jgi:hypothetical protein
MRLMFTALVALIAMTLSPQSASAQLRADARPVGAVAFDADSAGGVSRDHWRQAHPDSAQRPSSRVWPRYALTGAVLGGLAVAALAVSSCDQHCRDDGALAFLPPYLLAGVTLGALGGASIGIIVDRTRRTP